LNFRKCHPKWDWLYVHIGFLNLTRDFRISSMYACMNIHILLSHLKYVCVYVYTYSFLESDKRLSHLKDVCVYVYAYFVHICDIRISSTYIHIYIYVYIYPYVYLRSNLHFHRKSSLYLPLSSVNLVLKLMGTPDGISIRSG